ncbi:MAG: RluA family pseudouridine synthase, partial [Calditrichaeota bacterium]
MLENQPQEVNIRVQPEQPTLRIDRFLADHLPGVSRSYIKILIQNGKVTCAGKSVKASEKINPGDIITVQLEARPQPDIQPEKIALDIVQEDDALLVVNKPAGLVVHPAVGNWSGTLVNALAYHCNTLSSLSGETRPGIVHRLDKETSGLMVVAKNDVVHAALSQQFSEKRAGRIYQAVIWGIPALHQQKIESFISRNSRDRKKMMASAEGGKWAVTHLSVIEPFSTLASLCEFILETGRTHQIRVHSASIGHPVFGDSIYGGRKHGLGGLSQEKAIFTAKLLIEFRRQALHAK